MHAQKTGEENLKTDKKGVIHGQWIILQSATPRICSRELRRLTFPLLTDACLPSKDRSLSEVVGILMLN